MRENDVAMRVRRAGIGLSLALFALLFLANCNSTPPTASPDREWIVASNMVHPPFSSWNASGEAVGIEVDIVEAAAQDLGCTVKWIERPFPELIGAVEAGEIDLAVSTIGITDARAKRVAFSQPYFQTEIVALVNPASDMRSLEDLARSRIGADRSTTSHTAASKRWPNASLVGAAEEELSWPEMVQHKKIGAFVVDASDQERLETLTGVHLRRIEEPLKAEYFAVAVRRDSPEILAALNRAVEKLRSRGRLEMDRK